MGNTEWLWQTLRWIRRKPKDAVQVGVFAFAGIWIVMSVFNIPAWEMEALIALGIVALVIYSKWG